MKKNIKSKPTITLGRDLDWELLNLCWPDIEWKRIGNNFSYYGHNGIGITVDFAPSEGSLNALYSLSNCISRNGLRDKFKQTLEAEAKKECISLNDEIDLIMHLQNDFVIKAFYTTLTADL